MLRVVQKRLINRSESIQTGIGPVTVKVPKIRSAKTGKPVTFSLGAGATVRAQKRESLEAALPWLYLKGISTGEMATGT